MHICNSAIAYKTHFSYKVLIGLFLHGEYQMCSGGTQNTSFEAVFYG